MGAVTVVRGEGAQPDRTWMELHDGSTRAVAVHPAHDLPHLVVESLLALDDGLWGVLARGGFEPANQALGGRGRRRAKLVTDAPLGALGEAAWLGHRVAKTATNAVANRWGDGPDTPDGVRARLEAAAAAVPAGERDEYVRRLRRLAAEADDGTLALAIEGVRRLDAAWRALPPGGSLRLTWPLAPGGWVRR